MIADPKHYIATKDSGIEWLGKVPAHWTVGRVKRHYAIQLGKMLQPLPRNPQDVRVQYLKARNVQWFGLDTTNVDSMYASSDDIGRYGVETGDLLVCEGGEGGRCALAAGIQGIEPCIIQNALHRVRPHSRLDKRAARNDYLQFILSAVSSSGWFDALNDKATIAHFTVEKFGALPILMPPFAEQTAIARFLDHITSRIDRYIRAKQKLIALLEEQKQIIVHDAVTGRIDVRTGKPYPAYKPSGVEWFGDVPTHWDVRRLGQIGTLLKGRGGSKEDEMDEGVPCVRYGDLYTTHTWFITETRSSVLPEKAGDYRSIRFGDVLFAASGETTNEIGKSAVNLIRSRACCGGDIILFRSRLKLDPRFMGYAADCRASAAQKARMGRGFTVVHIYPHQIKRIALAIPPPPEQNAISRFLDEALANADQAIDRTHREIDLLQEYRTRLIADVVTGKLDVREAAFELPNPNTGSNGAGNETVYAESNPLLPDNSLGKEANP